MSKALRNVENNVQLGDLEKLLVGGDLSVLNQDQRCLYYKLMCEGLGLNPLSRPFEYIVLDNKLTLYARKDCTEQLRKINGISIDSIEDKEIRGMYVVIVKGKTKDGRPDVGTGVVPLEKEDGTWETNPKTGKRYLKGNGKYVPLRGDALANAMLKAETKAKRRFTLSICGLGMLDESEIEAIPGATVIEGEILNANAVVGADPDKEIDALIQNIKDAETASSAMNMFEAFWEYTRDHGKERRPEGQAVYEEKKRSFGISADGAKKKVVK